MKCILLSLSLLIFLQPVMAQRKYNKNPGAAGGIEVVKVQGGTFDLGSDDGAADRKPEHSVTLKDFYISTYEVTQDEWKQVMGNNPSAGNRCGGCPVNNVSYNDVLAYIGKLNTATGLHYRLPTEAEWECAARGGVNEKLVRTPQHVARGGVNEFLVADKNERTREKDVAGKKYSGKRLPQDVAWYERNSKGRVHEIGMKKPNELGIYDMSGNVEEWCADWYAGNYGSKLSVENPQGPGSGNSHVVRGGSFTSGPEDLVVTYRRAYLPDTKAPSLGFRLVEDK